MAREALRGMERLRGRVSRRRRAPLLWTAGLAPLIDVLFLLVLFLLVSASFDRRRVIDVELPEARSAEPLPRTEEQHRRVITLHADGSLAWAGRAVTLRELTDLLTGRPPEERLLPIVIEGDAGATYGAGIELLGALRGVGYRNCALQALPKRGSSQHEE
ncbi:MAG: ExbD/TolR family protein [Planctomycetota bacterium]